MAKGKKISASKAAAFLDWLAADGEKDLAERGSVCSCWNCYWLRHKMDTFGVCLSDINVALHDGGLPILEQDMMGKARACGDYKPQVSIAESAEARSVYMAAQRRETQEWWSRRVKTEPTEQGGSNETLGVKTRQEADT